MSNIAEGNTSEDERLEASFQKVENIQANKKEDEKQSKLCIFILNV